MWKIHSQGLHSLPPQALTLPHPLVYFLISPVLFANVFLPLKKHEIKTRLSPLIFMVTLVCCGEIIKHELTKNNSIC